MLLPRESASVGMQAESITFLSKKNRFFVQPPLLAEVEQSLRPLKWICITGPPDLGLAFVTEFQWLTVTFFSVTRPIHTAFPGGAVRNAQHVACLVNRRL